MQEEEEGQKQDKQTMGEWDREQYYFSNTLYTIWNIVESKKKIACNVFTNKVVWLWLTYVEIVLETLLVKLQ